MSSKGPKVISNEASRDPSLTRRTFLFFSLSGAASLTWTTVQAQTIPAMFWRRPITTAPTFTSVIGAAPLGAVALGSPP